MFVRSGGLTSCRGSNRYLPTSWSVIATVRPQHRPSNGRGGFQWCLFKIKPSPNVPAASDSRGVVATEAKARLKFKRPRWNHALNERQPRLSETPARSFPPEQTVGRYLLTLLYRVTRSSIAVGSHNERIQRRFLWCSPPGISAALMYRVYRGRAFFSEPQMSIELREG